MAGNSPFPPPTALAADRALVRGHLTGAAAGTGVALAWLALSWWHPALTYHFGLPLAAAAWPVLLRARLHRPGLLIAMAALGVAAVGHRLRGPTLLGTGSVPAEEVVLAVVAAAWGWRVARRRRRAWFLPAEHRPQGPADGRSP